MKKLNVLILIFLISFLIILLVNLFPRQDVKSMTELIDENDTKVIYNKTDMNQPFIYDNYDLKTTQTGQYIVSYVGRPIFCLYYDTACDLYLYQHLASKVVLYDANQDPLWSIGGRYSDDEQIFYENHHVMVYTITELSDQSFVAFGIGIENTTELLHHVLLFINQDGTLTNLETVSFEDYLPFDQTSGYDAYHIEGTPDGGFTLQYSSSQAGVIIYHYNHLYEYEWSQILPTNDPTQSPFSTELDVKDQIHLVLDGKSLYSFGMNGSIGWVRDYQHSVNLKLHSGKYENIFISRKLTQKRLITNMNLFKLNDRTEYVDTYVIDKINTENGHLVQSYHYQTVKYPNVSTHYVVDYVFEDRDYVYVILDTMLDEHVEITHGIFVLKYSVDGKFLGSSTVIERGSTLEEMLFSYHLRNALHDNNGKMSYVFHDSTLDIMIPNAQSNLSINLTLLPFEDSEPIDFNVEFSNAFIILRVVLNNLFIYGLIIYTAYLTTKFYIRRKKIKKDN